MWGFRPRNMNRSGSRSLVLGIGILLFQSGPGLEPKQAGASVEELVGGDHAPVQEVLLQIVEENGLYGPRKFLFPSLKFAPQALGFLVLLEYDALCPTAEEHSAGYGAHSPEASLFSQVDAFTRRVGVLQNM